MIRDCISLPLSLAFQNLFHSASIKEETETVSIQITGYVSSIFSYSIGPLTPSITILDNDDWNVSVTATDAAAAEAPAATPNHGTYTITRSNETYTLLIVTTRVENECY